MQEFVDMENFSLHSHARFFVSTRAHLERVGCEMDRNMFMHSLTQFSLHNVHFKCCQVIPVACLPTGGTVYFHTCLE